MLRYFKITEIDEFHFVSAAGDPGDCDQMVVPTDREVYVAIDDDAEFEMTVDLSCF